MESYEGVLGSLLRQPWARAVAVLSALALAGCYSNVWGPVPHPVPVKDTIDLRIVAEGSGTGEPEYKRVRVLDAAMDGDSVIVGRLWEPLGTTPAYRGRIRGDDALIVVDRQLDGLRTFLAVALPLGVLAYLVSQIELFPGGVINRRVLLAPAPPFGTIVR